MSLNENVTNQTSPDGFAANAIMFEDYTLFADTMFGGRIEVSYNPDTDKYEGTVIRHDGTHYVFNDIGCPAYPLDTNESSMNNLLEVADIAIKDSID